MMTPVESVFVELCLQKDSEAERGLNGKEFYNWY